MMYHEHWEADESKRKRLLTLISDPVFQEAASIIMMDATVMSTDIQHARGVNTAFTVLERMATPQQEEAPPRTRKVPWSHLRPQNEKQKSEGN